jgi:hypothetical protein
VQAAIQASLLAGNGILKTAKLCSVSNGPVKRMKAAMTGKRIEREAWDRIVLEPKHHRARGPRAHSITSSARAISNRGRVIPMDSAAFKLSTRSNFVGCSTGRSAGLVPLSIL